LIHRRPPIQRLLALGVVIPVRKVEIVFAPIGLRLLILRRPRLPLEIVIGRIIPRLVFIFSKNLQPDGTISRQR